MKIKIQLYLIALLLSAALSLNAASPEPRTMVCDFDGENTTKIYVHSLPCPE